MSGYNVSPHKIMVQKAKASGFEGSFFTDEKEAAMKLLWEHLTRSPDQAAAVAALRLELNDHLADFCKQWEVEPEPSPVA